MEDGLSAVIYENHSIKFVYEKVNLFSEKRIIQPRNPFDSLGIKVIWGAQMKSFDEIEKKVHIHFVDSTKHQDDIVDLLIGADGIHSPIRKQLVGDEIHPAGFNAVVGLIKKETDGSNDDLFEHELINNSGTLVSGRNGS